MGEEKRHEMMETLFGAESEDSDDEPEAVRQAISDQASDRSDKDVSYEEVEGEDADGDAEVDGEAESEGEKGESDAERGASDEEERAESDRESEGGRDVEVESEGEREEVEVSASGSERSHRAQAVEDYEDEEVQEEVRGQSEGEEDEQHDYEPREKFEVAEARDVFGESDEEEDQEVEREPEQEVEDRHSPGESLQGSPERAPSDDEGSEGDAARAEEIVADEDRDRSERSESDDERYIEQKPEKPMGPPIELQIPLRPPPGMPEQLNIVRTSNIMSIDMKPFDPKTYEAQEPFTTEVEGQKQHIRLEENVVRWRRVLNRDGTESYESNARFVKWSDGSMQLLLGGEVLDLSVQNAAQDQSHLFVRHPKTTLQSQGQVLRKMRFMPSSLTSKSHRLLTAKVDAKHKKVFKVKAVITETDPEKEKHETEKQLAERIRSREDLQKKQDKLNRKFENTPRPRVTERERALSPGYLEDALEEEDEADPYDRRSRRYQEQLEQEQRAERRLINTKKHAPARPAPSRPANRRAPPKDDFLDDYMSDDSDREPSAQESDHNDDLVGGAWEEEDEEEEEERRPSSRGKAVEREDRRREEDDRKRKRDREERSPSPAKKPVSRRRVVVSDSDDD